MSKLKDLKNIDNAEDVVKELPELSGTGESDEENGEIEEIDEDEVNKELVTWAGRLELESIDLREKSKLLVSRMTKNTETIMNTTTDLKKEFSTWKAISKTSLENAVATFSKSTKSLLTATKTFSRLKERDTEPPAELSKVLEILQSTKSSIDIIKRNNDSSQFGNQQVDALQSLINKKLQVVITEFTRLNRRYDNFEKNQKQNKMSLQTLNDTVLNCLRRIEDVQNLQIDFGKDLYTLSKSQSLLTSEFQKLESDLLENTTSEVHMPLTPNSSLNDSMGTFTNNHNAIIEVNHQSALQFRSPLSQIKHNGQSQMSQYQPTQKKRSRGRPPGHKFTPAKPTRTIRTRGKCTTDEHRLLCDLPATDRAKRKKTIPSTNTNNTSQPSPRPKPFASVQNDSIVSLLSDEISPSDQLSSEL